MRKLVYWAAMAALGIAVALVASQVEWGRFGQVLGAVDPLWVAVAIVTNIASVFARALRWAIAIPLTRQLGAVWAAVNIGYLGNLVFPLRAGEVFRLGILAQLSGVGLPRLSASAVVDRASDGLHLVLFLAVVAAWHGPGLLGKGTAGNIVVWSSAVLAAVALIIAFAGPMGRRLRRAGGRLAPAGVAALGMAALLEVLAALEGIGSKRRLVGILTAGCGAALLDVVGAYCIILAFGWDVSPLAALTFVVFLWIGFALPLVPGALGVYQVAGVLALATLNIGTTEAVAYSIVCQIVGNMVILVQGIGSAVYFGIGRQSAVASGEALRQRAISKDNG